MLAFSHSPGAQAVPYRVDTWERYSIFNTRMLTIGLLTPSISPAINRVGDK